MNRLSRTLAVAATLLAVSPLAVVWMPRSTADPVEDTAPEGTFLDRIEQGAAATSGAPALSTDTWGWDQAGDVIEAEAGAPIEPPQNDIAREAWFIWETGLDVSPQVGTPR